MTEPIRSRAELLANLAVACELEQGLCLQYLFTAFTLKDDFADGGINTNAQLTAVRKWKASIFHVAAQEMLHLTQAANLCAAAGGTVQLRRPNFPQAAGYYPTDLPWQLLPFSREAMEIYICYERPTGEDTIVQADPPFDCGCYTDPTKAWSRHPGKHPEGPFAHLPDDLAGHHPRATDALTIGQLYDRIEQAFVELPDVIIGAPPYQVDGRLVDFPQVSKVLTRGDAVEAIDLIVRQGEGCRSDREDSHFGVFLGIRDEYLALKAKDPDFEPGRRVHQNPLSRLHVDNGYPGWRLITDDYTRAVNDLCSSTYTTMVLMLYRFFATTDIGQRKTMRTTFLRIMTGVIKPLGEALTKLPMGPGTEGWCAGPSFEIGRDVQLLPQAGASWRYLTDRLRDESGRAAALGAKPGAPAELNDAALTLQQLATLFGAGAPSPTGGA